MPLGPCPPAPATGSAAPMPSHVPPLTPPLSTLASLLSYFPLLSCFPPPAGLRPTSAPTRSPGGPKQPLVVVVSQVPARAASGSQPATQPMPANQSAVAAGGRFGCAGGRHHTPAAAPDRACTFSRAASAAGAGALPPPWLLTSPPRGVYSFHSQLQHPSSLASLPSRVPLPQSRCS